MITNKVTAQFAAEIAALNLTHTRCKQPCMAHFNETIWTEALLADLPDVDPAVVGQVMMHIGMRLPNLEIGLVLLGRRSSELLPIITGTLATVGAELLAKNKGGETETTQPAADDGAGPADDTAPKAGN